MTFPLTSATIDLDFQHGQYYDSAVGSTTPGAQISLSRSSNAYALNNAGLWVGFGGNTFCITDLGLTVEDHRTNVVLWCRDLTNVAWTKSNITAALDQTGADGGANSASSLTATAANGTVLQSITLAVSQRMQSVVAKRLIGTGTINMTMDNGATWTAITLTSAYRQVSIPTQNIANPTVGFQIVTNGDSIAVDFVQNEDLPNSSGLATSPIPTTTVAVTRAANSMITTGNLNTLVNGAALTVIADATNLGNQFSNMWISYGRFNASIIHLLGTSGPPQGTRGQDGSGNNADSVPPAGSGLLWIGNGMRGGVGFDGSALSSCTAGGSVAHPGTYANAMANQQYICGVSDDNTYARVRRLTWWNFRLDDSVLQDMTAPDKILFTGGGYDWINQSVTAVAE